MRMRERPWPLLLAVAACFSEPVTSAGECVDGRPGCDCRVGQLCDEGSECVASIDKCVPVECTPGELTCTCIDIGAGMCSGALQCQGGVCLEPGTGSETSASDSNADAGTGSTTLGSSTTTSVDTLSTTGPLSSTSITDTLDGSSTIDPTGVVESSSSGSAPIDCVECLQKAAVDSCSDEFGTCTANEGTNTCTTLAQCVLEEVGSIAECCEQNDARAARIQWNAFALCADANSCELMCLSNCPI